MPTKKEYENLIVRLDERTLNILRIMGNLEDCQRLQNGKVNKLSRNFWGLIGFLAGSGILGGGYLALFN